MVRSVSIGEIEAVINQLRLATPPNGGKLPAPLCIAAELYGTMIYTGARSVDIDSLSEESKLLLTKYLTAQ